MDPGAERSPQMAGSPSVLPPPWTPLDAQPRHSASRARLSRQRSAPLLSGPCTPGGIRSADCHRVTRLRSGDLKRRPYGSGPIFEVAKAESSLRRHARPSRISTLGDLLWYFLTRLDGKFFWGRPARPSPRGDAPSPAPSPAPRHNLNVNPRLDQSSPPVAGWDTSRLLRFSYLTGRISLPGRRAEASSAGLLPASLSVYSLFLDVSARLSSSNRHLRLSGASFARSGSTTGGPTAPRGSTTGGRTSSATGRSWACSSFSRSPAFCSRRFGSRCPTRPSRSGPRWVGRAASCSWHSGSRARRPRRRACGPGGCTAGGDGK